MVDGLDGLPQLDNATGCKRGGRSSMIKSMLLLIALAVPLGAAGAENLTQRGLGQRSVCRATRVKWVTPSFNRSPERGRLVVSEPERTGLH